MIVLAVFTGSLSKQAYEEAKKYGKVRIAGGKEEGPYTSVPDPSTCEFDSEASYLYYCHDEINEGNNV